jgi:hypothetical protein
MLNKEAVVIRAKPKRKKDKAALTQAATTNEKLNVYVFVVSALRSNKEVERRLRNESKEADKAVGRVEQLELSRSRGEVKNLKEQLEAEQYPVWAHVGQGGGGRTGQTKKEEG